MMAQVAMTRGRGKRGVSDGDIASGKKEIGNVARVETAIGNSVRRGRRMKDGRLTGIENAGRVVVVHGPAAVSDQVGELATGADVVLGQDVVADEAAIFPFAGKRAHPFQCPIFGLGTSVGAVLYVVPDAVADFHQIVADGLSVADRVLEAADLEPPEIGRVHAVDAVRQIGFGFKAVGPTRGNEGLWLIGPAQLKEQGIAHRLFIALEGWMSSSNSERASRPVRKSAPVTAARMLSPEQSMKVLALMVCQVWDVSCHALMATILSPSISASVQEQFRKGVRLG